MTTNALAGLERQIVNGDISYNRLVFNNKGLGSNKRAVAEADAMITATARRTTDGRLLLTDEELNSAERILTIAARSRG